MSEGMTAAATGGGPAEPPTEPEGRLSAEAENAIAEGMRPSVYARLLALRPHLECNGVLQRRARDDTLRYRVRDGERHRSITLREGAEAAAALHLITGWRNERYARDAKEARERLAREAQARAEEKPDEPCEGYNARVAEIRRDILKDFGGGGKRRRRIAREIREAARDPRRLVGYLVSRAFALPNRRPGRKPRSALC